MADPNSLEIPVFAFLDHLKQHKREREHVEYVLLKELVELAKREGYHFTAEDFKHVVTVELHYGIELIKWPPGHV